MELFDIVMKLNGPVWAVGDSGIDDDRYKNLVNLIGLADRVLYVIEVASLSADYPEASMAKIGKRAKNFIDGVKQA